MDIIDFYSIIRRNKLNGQLAQKIAMRSIHLTMVTVLGILVNAELLTSGKALGIALFFAAFAVTDTDTWRGVRNVIRIQ